MYRKIINDSYYSEIVLYTAQKVSHIMIFTLFSYLFKPKPVS